MSDLCEKNFTIIVKLFRKSPLVKTGLAYIDEKQNIIKGIFGSKMNALVHHKSSIGDCKLIGDVELGTEESNHTFSGALGLLQAGKGDLMLDSLSQHLKKDWLEHSHASSQEE